VLDTDSSKPYIVVHAAVDIVLLFIALVGLLRLSRDGGVGGDKIGLGPFLWNQVEYFSFHSDVIASSAR
jgi:hypothetical protein